MYIITSAVGTSFFIAEKQRMIPQITPKKFASERAAEIFIEGLPRQVQTCCVVQQELEPDWDILAEEWEEAAYYVEL